jgi:hypothetical protein
MNRSTLAVLVGLLAAACSSSPTTPATGAAFPVIGPAVGPAVVDLARCLSGVADAVCFSGARPVAHAVTAGATAPGAPGGLTARSNGSFVTLTWSAPGSGDPVVTYVIEAGSSSGLSNLAVVPTNSTSTTFLASGVADGTYYVRVKAQNAAGTSAASNEATLVVGATTCTSVPLTPSGLTSGANGGSVTLQWAPSPGVCTATSYILQAGLTSGSSALANSNVGNVTSYTATGVGAGTYYVRVRAVNAFGQSPPSNEIVLVVGTTSTPVTLTGSWSGTLGSPGDPDPDTMTWTATQTGNSVTGPMVYTNAGRPPSINGTIAGTISGSQVSLTFTLGPGSWVPVGGPSTCGVTGTAVSTPTATSLIASLTMIFDPSCVGTVSKGLTATNQLSLTKR